MFKASLVCTETVRPKQGTAEVLWMPRTVFAASTRVDYAGLNVGATQWQNVKEELILGLGLNRKHFWNEHNGPLHAVQRTHWSGPDHFRRLMQLKGILMHAASVSDSNNNTSPDFKMSNPLLFAEQLLSFGSSEWWVGDGAVGQYCSGPDPDPMFCLQVHLLSPSLPVTQTIRRTVTVPSWCIAFCRDSLTSLWTLRTVSYNPAGLLGFSSSCSLSCIFTWLCRCLRLMSFRPKWSLVSLVSMFGSFSFNLIGSICELQ